MKQLRVGMIGLCIAFSACLVTARESFKDKPLEFQPPAAAVHGADIEVWFSPNGGCTAAVIHELDNATRQIRIQAYSFTSTQINAAVAKAKERGVDVEVVLDKSQAEERYTAATYLTHHNVPVYIDRKHAIAHNKIMIIDGQEVIGGSFNYTQQAERDNAENLTITRSPELAAAYLRNFELHKEHSEPYSGGQNPSSK
ncbi:MAG TPA: phospholipase D family protein [Tepidisphaeraceae bacterium]|jgi:phosphatidylserine/phosphatidylglycerophosphate/cardiolipin synthase-like enzyme